MKRRQLLGKDMTDVNHFPDSCVYCLKAVRVYYSPGCYKGSVDAFLLLSHHHHPLPLDVWCVQRWL